MPNKQATSWQLKSSTLKFQAMPSVMGIVNVTPDSFSDGGKFLDVDKAVEHALLLAEQGADILDIGGESTRPYSDPVSESDELERVIPVIESLAKATDIPISIDTSKAKVAEAAIGAGAEIINDVSGLEGDPLMIDVARETGAGVCAMHMQGTPQTMQDDPAYVDVTDDIYEYLQRRRDSLLESGLQAEKICLDPGIGFGKTHQHNFKLINRCGRFLELGHPILIGHSRKGFVAKAIGDKQRDRDFGTLAVSLWLAHSGMHVLRVHNVKATVDGLKLWQQIA